MKIAANLKSILSNLIKLSCISTLLLFSFNVQADYNSGTLRVVTEAEFPPYEFKGRVSKQFIGFDVDIITAVLASQGYRAEFIHVPFTKVLSDILKGNAEVAICALSITDARKALVHFSEPYLESSQSLFVRNELKDLIKSTDDMDNRTVCAQTNSTGHEYTAENLNVTLIDYQTTTQCLEAVLSGNCDAAIADKSSIEYYISHNKNVNGFMLEENLFQEKFAIVTSQDRPHLSNLIDEGLKSIKEDGTYDKIYEKWFGSLGFLLMELDM